MRAQEIAKLRERFKGYVENPVKYVEEVILPGHPGVKIQPYQADVMDAIAQHNRVAAAMANGMGKDAMTAWMIEWYLATHFGARIPCTSAVERQIKDILFAEVGKWTGASLARGLFLIGSTSLRVRGHERDWFALGFTAGNTSSAEGGEGAKSEGFHAKNLLYVVTEARGVPGYAWDAVRKATTMPGNKIFAQGIPGAEAGEFYRIFSHRGAWRAFIFPSARKDGAGQWESCSELVSLDSIREKAERGEDSAAFVNGVLCQFSHQSERTLIPIDWIRKAMERKPQLVDKNAPAEEREITYGVDPSHGVEGGDNTAIAMRRGRDILALEVCRNDTQVTAERVFGMWQANRGRIYVDSVGVGAGVIDRLRALGAEVIGVNSGMRPPHPEAYVRTRDELWWNLREMLDPANGYDICLPDDPELLNELSGILFEKTIENKIRVESKTEMRRRMSGKSPDRSDSLCLAFWRRFRFPKKAVDEKVAVAVRDPGKFLDLPGPRDEIMVDPISGMPL